MVTPISPLSLDAELQRLTSRALSPVSRYGHVALLLAALMMSALVCALLLTEPALPPRTQAAFAVMLGIGGGWVAYASWVLRQRRPLLAGHRVVAGWMAVGFTAVFLGAALAAAIASGTTMASTAAATGAAMLLLAVAALVQAYRRVARLQARRRELEQRLGRAS